MCYTSLFFYPKWNKAGTEATISWDVSGYYWYLPSIFIYKDLKHQSFADSILHKYQPTNTEFQQATKTDNSSYVMKYSSGMAVIYSPFFLVAHMLARPLGYPADGFSAPYQLAIQLGGLLVSILGLWYFRKLLLLFYDDKVVAIVLVLLCLGSNYLNYATVDCGMSHCWLFTVYVFILLNTYYYYKSFQIKYAVRLGLLIGLAVLTRPTDIVSCLIPLLWGMENISNTSIRNRLLLIFKNYKGFITAIVFACAVIAIQVVYWKYASGHWLYYSYNDQHLYFRSPNFGDYTFSYRSGWLTYSPMLMLAFIGVIPYIKSGSNKVAIITFFLINYYVVCSWSIWWYGGRAMVQSYPVLFILIAELVKYCMQRRVALALLGTVATVFVYYNIWLLYQSHHDGLLVNDGMKKAYFWHIVGRWKTEDSALLLNDNPDWYTGKRTDERLIFEDDFANDTGVIYVPKKQGAGKTLVLTNEHQSSNNINVPLPITNARYIRAEAIFHAAEKEWTQWKMAQFVLRLMDGNTVVKENMVRVHAVLSDNATRKISVDMKLSKGGYNGAQILFWNGGSTYSIAVDSLKLWSFN